VNFFFQENPDNCSGFGFYIYFSKTNVISIHGGIKQILPTKKIEDGGTSIFASRDRAAIDAYRTQSFTRYNLKAMNSYFLKYIVS
jgi:hypothetical protein